MRKTKALTRPDLWAGIILGAVVMLAYGAVGQQDYTDERAAFERACMMIDAGAWPAEVEPACVGREGPK